MSDETLDPRDLAIRDLHGQLALALMYLRRYAQEERPPDAQFVETFIRVTQALLTANDPLRHRATLIDLYRRLQELRAACAALFYEYDKTGQIDDALYDECARALAEATALHNEIYRLDTGQIR